MEAIRSARLKVGVDQLGGAGVAYWRPIAERYRVELEVVNDIVDMLLKTAPHALLLVVSNPVDVLTYAAWKRTGWPRSRVFGMAGVLDSARMASFVAMETGFSVRDITAMVLGGHCDTMVPMTRFTCINGIPIGTS
jgi:malate dehydrogenase